jgi:O-antigen/teichoic acid export membrane protein
VAELGLYFLAAKIAFLPAELSGEVVAAVAFPLYARLQSNLRRAANAFRTLLTGITVLLFPALCLIVVLAPSLVEQVLSARWAGTAPIIQVLAIACMLDLFRDATVPIFNGLGQPDRVTVLEAVQSSLLVVFVWVLAERFGVIGAAAAWIPALAASQLLGVVFLRRMLDRPFQGLGRPMLTVVGVSAVGVVVAYVVDRTIPGLTGFVLANLLAVATIGGALWIADRRFNLRLVQTLAQAFPRMAVLLGLSTGGDESHGVS